MPENNKEKAGVISVLAGIALLTFAGIRIGSKVDVWSERLQDKLEAKYEGEVYNPTIEETEKNQKYLMNTGYIGAGGLSALIFGVVLASSKSSFNPFQWNKSTGYDSHSNWKRSNYHPRGTPDNPWKL